MSYQIEYNRKVFKDPKTDLHLLFIREGCNNVDPRPKDWYLDAVGTQGELWKVLGKRAGNVMGGGLQRAKGWNNAEWIDILDYVSIYRKALKNPKPIENAFEEFRMTMVINKKPEISDSTLKTRIDHVIHEADLKPSTVSWWLKDDGYTEEYKLLINSTEVLMGVHDLISYKGDVYIYLKVDERGGNRYGY